MNLVPVKYIVYIVKVDIIFMTQLVLDPGRHLQCKFNIKHLLSTEITKKLFKVNRTTMGDSKLMKYSSCCSFGYMSEVFIYLPLY